MRSGAMDMTKGSILKALISFAIPILIGNIFQQLYNICDIAIIGNLMGDDALAAVGAAAPTFQLLIWFAFGFTNGFAVVIARHFGAHDEKKLRTSVNLSYILAGIICLTLMIISFIGLHPLMLWLKTPANIISGTESYMRVVIIYYVVSVAYNLFAAILRAIGNSRIPLYFLILATILNVGLDYLFVGGFNMGVAGAAYATVIAQAIASILCLIYIIKRCDIVLFRKNDLIFDRAIFTDLASTGLSMGMMNAIVSVGSIILQSAVNGFGTATITAHSAARKIDDFFLIPMATMAVSCATFSGQNIGAGEVSRVKKGIRYGILISIVWGAFATVISIVFSHPIMHLITGSSDPTVLSTGSMYIAWNISFFSVLSVLLILRQSLQGIGHKLIPISGSVVEFTFKIIAAVWFAPRLGYFCVCILEPIIWTVCAGIVAVDYLVFLKRSKSIDNNPVT